MKNTIETFAARRVLNISVAIIILYLRETPPFMQKYIILLLFYYGNNRVRSAVTMKNDSDKGTTNWCRRVQKNTSISIHKAEIII